MIVAGLDPGKHGGLARWDGFLMACWALPENEQDIYRLLVQAKPDFVYLEKVSAMPGQGVTSCFSFGHSVGFLRGLLTAIQIPFETVTAGKWQRALGCLSGGEKNVTKRKAQELFPYLKITHAVADSILLCEYGRRLRAGELK